MTATYKHFNVTSPIEYVYHVEINRPEKLNAFHEAMWKEFHLIMDTLSYSSSCRAILLSGAGPRAFTAGLDVQAASEPGSVLNPSASSASAPLDAARQATSIRRHILDFQADISAAERCEKPVICVMHGYAMGLGIDMSCCADVRLCARDTQFCVKEVDIGLAADIGTLTRLPKVVGSFSWCKDVCMSARVFGADEALRVGFVSGVYEGKEEAVRKGLELAALMASKSPVAVQGTKDVLNYSREHGTESGLKYISVWNGAALQTSDVTNAIKGNLTRQKPRFEKL